MSIPSWAEKIIAAHTAVTDQVSHGKRMKSDRYFVWTENADDDDVADNRHGEIAVTGTTDFFTKLEFDPWKEAFERALDDAGILWKRVDVLFEDETDFWHYVWDWTVV